MKNRRLYIGMFVGSIVGIIDLIPMIIQGLTWDANASAFCMWVVVGVFISSINWKINNILKGIIVSLLVFLPCGIIIGSREVFALIPIILMTLILGGLSGYLISKILKYKEI